MDQFVSKSSMSTVELLSFLITLIAQPILCFIGTLLNGGFVVALLPSFQHQYCRKTSLVIYLIVLSLCNIVQLTLSVFIIILPAAEQFIDDELYPQMYKNLRKFNAQTMFYLYPIIMAANYASLWILNLISLHRYQTICHPNSVWKSKLQVFRKSKRCVAIVLFLAIVINIPRYWEQRFNESGTTHQDELYQSFFYKFIQEGMIYAFLVYGLPTCLLVWVNYNTIKLVWFHDNTSSPTCHNRSSAEHRTAHMTISFFILFFLCTTMAASLKFIAIFAGDMFFSIEVIWLVDMSNLLANASALSIPIVCFVFTSGFRDLFFVIRHATHNQHFKALLPVQI